MEGKSVRDMTDEELYRFITTSEWVDWDGLDEAEYRTGVHCGTGFNDATVGEVYDTLLEKIRRDKKSRGAV